MSVTYWLDGNLTTASNVPSVTSPELNRELWNIPDHISRYSGSGGDQDLDSLVTVPKATSQILWAYTRPGQPGTRGGTGNGSATVVAPYVSSSNSGLELDVQLHRTNSSGTIQTSGGWSPVETLANTGTYTFTWSSNLDLGTWTATDRLLCQFRYTNPSAHGSTQSIQVLYGNPDAAGNYNTGYVTLERPARTIITT